MQREKDGFAWLKNSSLVVATILGLAGLGRLVFDGGRAIERLDSLVEEQAKIREQLVAQQAALVDAAEDRARVEAKVQLVAETLARRNRWSNKASEDVLRRLDDLNHKGTAVLDERP